MKKITLLASLFAFAFCLVSCKSDPIEKFIGTWGVERLEYYVVDYAGNPIDNTIEVHEFGIGDPDNGIDMIFKNDKMGEMRRRDIDTFNIQISVDPEEYETIINPDTTVVISFDYTYDSDMSALFVTMHDDMHTFMMKVSNLTDDSFMYVNEYDLHRVEKAYLKRISNATRSQKSASKPTYRPRKPGSFMSN